MDEIREENRDWTLEQKVELMKREIDGMQADLMNTNRPWFRNASTIIAVIALIFSFGTTYVSYKRTKALEIQSARQELRGLLQRLAALPKENLEAVKKYAGDPAAALLVGGFINQENAMLSRQASEIARRLPSDIVSPTEYYAVAIALQNAYELSGAREFLRLSLAAAEARSDFNSEIGALRMMASLHFVTGNPEEGRVEYQRARGIFTRYPNFDQYTKVSTNVWTELSWASSEAVARSPMLVHQHLESASSLLAELAPSPGLDALRAQVDQAKNQFMVMGQVANPSGQPSLALTPMEK